MGCNTIVGKGRFACKTLPRVQEMPTAVERVSTLPSQDNRGFLNPLPTHLPCVRNFVLIWPLESTLRLTKLGPGTQASVWTRVSGGRGVCARSLAAPSSYRDDLQRAIKADGCILWSLVTCGSDNEVFCSPDNILFCHYGFLPPVTSPNLYCFTAYC